MKCIGQICLVLAQRKSLCLYFVEGGKVLTSLKPKLLKGLKVEMETEMPTKLNHGALEEGKEV